MQGCLMETHFPVLRVLGLFESEASRPCFIPWPWATLSLPLFPTLCVVLRGKESSRFPKGVDKSLGSPIPGLSHSAC